MRTSNITIFAISFITLFISCKDKVDYPDVSINDIENITHNSAIVNSEITSCGTFDNGNLNRGVCMNETGNPTMEDNIIIDFYRENYSSVEFKSGIENLKPNTKYYVRAWITTNQPPKTIYSNEIEFITNKVDSIIDRRDNQVYQIVKIGDQYWFAENLNFFTTSGSSVSTNEKGKVYGLLYNYETAQSACPAGWHVSTDEDWKRLEKELGMTNEEVNSFGFRGKDAGAKLKTPGSSNWVINAFSTNEVGFTALPGGIIPEESGNKPIQGFGNHGTFLTSTIDSTNSYLYIRDLASHEYGIDRRYGSKETKYSVRCVKDN